MNLIISSVINSISLSIYENSQHLTVVIIFCFISIVPVIALFFLFNKKKYVFIIFDVLVLISFLYATMLLYNRGYKLNEIRNNGYILLHSIENFKSDKNRLPYDIQEIYNYLSLKKNNELQKIKRTENRYYYYILPSDSGNVSNFNLTIQDEILGFEYFAYRRNPERFELTDD